MKNNFYFDFFFSYAITDLSIGSVETVRAVLILFYGKNIKKPVRLFVEEEQFFSYPLFCLQFCIALL